jgi:hypothetical protein
MEPTLKVGSISDYLFPSNDNLSFGHQVDSTLEVESTSMPLSFSSDDNLAFCFALFYRMLGLSR